MCTPCNIQGSEIVRGLQTPLGNRNCFSIFKQHWHQAGWHKRKSCLCIWSFQVSSLALQPSAMLQALLPKRGRSSNSLPPCDAFPTTKLKEVKKPTKSRPLPEGHTSDLHNMLVKVFQPQKDFHTLVSISEYMLAKCTLNGPMNQLALGSCRLCGNPCEILQVYVHPFFTLRSELPSPYPNINAFAFLHLQLHPPASYQLVILWKNTGMTSGMTSGTSKWNVVAMVALLTHKRKRLKEITRTGWELEGASTLGKTNSLVKHLPHNHQSAMDTSNHKIIGVPWTPLPTV